MRKNNITFFLLIGFLSSTFVVAQNPHKVGLETRRLNPQEIKSRKQYVAQSKRQLEKVLKTVKGKGLIETYRLYYETIVRVVRKSFHDELLGELLMQIVLNQAMEYAVGIPERPIDGEVDSSEADNIRFEKGSILDRYVVLEDVNKLSDAELIKRDFIPLRVSILKNSINRALVLIKENNEDSEDLNLADLPYGKVAAERAITAKKWATGILHPKIKIGFLRNILERWMSTIGQPGNMVPEQHADLELDIDRFLRNYDTSPLTIDQKIRKMNSLISDIEEIKKQANWKTKSTNLLSALKKGYVGNNDIAGLQPYLESNKPPAQIVKELDIKANDLVMPLATENTFIAKSGIFNFYSDDDGNNMVVDRENTEYACEGTPGSKRFVFKAAIQRYENSSTTVDMIFSLSNNLGEEFFEVNGTKFYIVNMILDFHDQYVNRNILMSYKVNQSIDFSRNKKIKRNDIVYNVSLVQPDLKINFSVACPRDLKSEA